MDLVDELGTEMSTKNTFLVLYLLIVAWQCGQALELDITRPEEQNSLTGEWKAGWFSSVDALLSTPVLTFEVLPACLIPDGSQLVFC